MAKRNKGQREEDAETPIVEILTDSPKKSASAKTLDDLREQLGEALTRAETAERQERILSGKVKALSSASEKAETKALEEEAAANTLRTNLAKANARATEAKKLQVEAEAKAEELERALEDANKAKTAAETALKKTKEDLKAKSEELTEANKAREDAEKTTKATQDAAKAIERLAQERIDDLQNEAEDRKIRIAALESGNRRLTEANTTLHNRADELGTENTALKQKVTKFEEEIEELNKPPILREREKRPLRPTLMADGHVSGTTIEVWWNEIIGAQSYQAQVWDGEAWTNLTRRSMTLQTVDGNPMIGENRYRVQALMEHEIKVISNEVTVNYPPFRTRLPERTREEPKTDWSPRGIWNRGKMR